MNDLFLSTKQDLQKFIDNKSFEKILVIAGSKSFDLSGLREFFSSTKKKNINFFFKKNSYPDYDELVKIINTIKIISPDLIIAAGGGSVIDYAKIANAVHLNNNLQNEIKNSSCKLSKQKRKLLAIPTTAGSGAEVTSNAVIYINGVKYSVEGALIKPDFFFLIPEFINGASKKIKASAGFDAIAQSIESLMSKKSNKKSVSFAKRSLDLSLNYFIKFLSNPSHENTCAMSLAANLSGEAISISKTTAPHAVSYPFTSLFNISHGHAVSLTINKFMILNYKNLHSSEVNFDLKERFKILFDVTKSNNINEFDLFLKQIKKEANLECNFEKLGIDIKLSVSKILEDINNQRLSNNPVKVDKEIVKKILLESNEKI
jgi:alcohol dehydrogenase